jgi:hypothetical protein
VSAPTGVEPWPGDTDDARQPDEDDGVTEYRAPLLPRPVLVTGAVIGVALVVLAYWGGAHPRVLAAGFLGYVAGFVLVAIVCVGMATAATELLRRHGKRGALASARAAGRGYRTARDRGTQWAGPRWQGRQSGSEPLAIEPGPEGTGAGAPAPEPASAPAPADNTEGDTPMTTDVAPTGGAPAARGGRSRALAEASKAAPPAWHRVADGLAGFEPDEDIDLADLIDGEAAGHILYGSAVETLYETCVHVTGVMPGALALLHDLAEIAAEAAEKAAAARSKYAQSYQAVSEWLGEGSNKLARESAYHTAELADRV